MTESAYSEQEKALFRFMVLVHEKMLKPYMDSFKNQLSMLQLCVIALLEEYGEMTMSQLAQKLHITRQQMTQVVSRLCEMGFVERVFDEEDRRLIYIYCTPTATQYVRSNTNAFLNDFLKKTEMLGEKEKWMDMVSTANCILQHINTKESGMSTAMEEMQNKSITEIENPG